MSVTIAPGLNDRQADEDGPHRAATQVLEDQKRQPRLQRRVDRPGHDRDDADDERDEVLDQQLKFKVGPQVGNRMSGDRVIWRSTSAYRRAAPFPNAPPGGSGRQREDRASRAGSSSPRPAVEFVHRVRERSSAACGRRGQPVGSSATISVGSVAEGAGDARRPACCWPPASWPGRCTT